MGLYFPCGGAPLPNDPVSKYRCVNLPKTGDNYRTHENDANALLDIWSMLLSGQVPPSDQFKSIVLEWAVPEEKTKPKRGRREKSRGHTFFEKNPWNCFGFSLCPWKFQVKQNSTPGNLVKLCTYVTSLRNFKAKTHNPFLRQELSH